MAIFSAYLDASGSRDDPGVSALTIAGFVAHEDSWTRFEKDWHGALDDVAELHMKDLAFFRGEFKGWSDDQRAELLSRLVAVIGKHVKMGFSATVSLLAYRKALEWYDMPEAFEPYAIAAGAAVESIEQWRSPGDRVSYLFEKGDANQQSLIVGMQSFFGFNLPSPPSFMCKRYESDGKTYYCYPFQAADYLAYEHAKYVKDRHADPNKQGVRRSLDALRLAIGNSQVLCRYFDLPTYLELCMEHNVPTRSAAR